MIRICDIYHILIEKLRLHGAVDEPLNLQTCCWLTFVLITILIIFRYFSKEIAEN